MAGVSETNRKKIASILIALGTGLILIGFLFVLSRPPEEPHTATTRAVLPPHTRALLMRQILFWLIVFSLIFAVSTFAFLRWSRRFRAWMNRKPSAPTPSDDVWAMHKLPEGALDEWRDVEPEDGPGPGPQPGHPG